MEKGIPYKWKRKESQGSSTCITQNRLANNDFSKRQKGYYIMIKRSIQQEDITIVNIYAPNIEGLKYIKQMNRNKGRN